jgi:xanthine dehydrogenase iron-sulfur cluster and FAD-binding subunit A
LQEALSARREVPEAVVVAGGTEVMPLRNRGGRAGPVLDLSRVEELSAAASSGDGVQLGAGVTYTALLEGLGREVPVLALAARTIASRQVRNRATLGGALAIADPSADVLCALVAAGAEVELASAAGVRRLPVDRFLTGPYENDLGNEELIVSVSVPRAGCGPASYAKVGARNAMARAACAVAVVLDVERRSAGIGVAACAPTPVRASDAERVVAEEAPWDGGGELDAAWLRGLGALVASATRPRADGRGSVEYKRHAAAVLSGRALARAWRRRGTPGTTAIEGSGTKRPIYGRNVPHPSGTDPLIALSLRIDGADHSFPANAGGQSLLRVLRDELAITAPKNACEEGECGSCTVAIDGEIACACLVPAVQAAGCEVETAAGLADADGELHPVQAALLEAGGVQCGFCTPGFVMAARDLLRRVPDPTGEQIREGLNGNLCRCTGYRKIVEAVRLAADR